MLGIVTQLAGFGVAGENSLPRSPAAHRQRISATCSAEIGCPMTTAIRPRRKARRPRPGLISAVQADRHEGHAAAAGDGNKAGLQRGDFAVTGARAFGKDEHELACFQAAQRFFEPRQADPFAVDGNGVEELDERREDRNSKQRIASQIVHSPGAGQTDEWRIEHALVIGADQPPPVAGQFSRPLTQAIEPDTHRASQYAKRIVAKPLGERAFRGVTGGGCHKVQVQALSRTICSSRSKSLPQASNDRSLLPRRRSL